MRELKAKRVRLGLSQIELAKMLGISHVWLNTLENNKKKSPKIEKRINEILNNIESERVGVENIPTLS